MEKPFQFLPPFAIAIGFALTLSACSGGANSLVGSAIATNSDAKAAIVPLPWSTPTASIGVAKAAASSAPADPEATVTPMVVIHSGTILAPVHSSIYGVNNGVRFEGASTYTQLESPLASIGVKAGRWPGVADEYNWTKNATCTSTGPTIADPTGNFDAYMNNLESPLGSDLEITVNYGTGDFPSCDQPGDPALAAAWVNYSNVVKNYGVKWWEVGNEVWETVEPDKHSPANNVGSYTKYEPAFYSQMKAADPTINVGIPVTGANWSTYWNTTVVSQAQFDYVAYHFYPERAGSENDASLLASPQTIMRSDLALIRSQLAKAGKNNIPISISEWNSVPNYPGKQSISIVSGLFAAETLGEMLNDNVSRAEIWSDTGCNQQKVNNDPSLYGWQNFGAGAVVSPSVPDAQYNLCPTANTSMTYGTPYPMGRALQLLSATGFATDGQSVLSTSSASASVLSYAVTTPNGISVMLINIDENFTATVPMAIDGLNAGLRYKWMRYGKAEYDQSQSGKWVGAVSGVGGIWLGHINAVLPPWSITVYMIPK